MGGLVESKVLGVSFLSPSNPPKRTTIKYSIHAASTSIITLPRKLAKKKKGSPLPSCSALKEAPLNKAFCYLQGGSLPVISGVIHPNKWATAVITNPTYKGNTVDGAKILHQQGCIKPCINDGINYQPQLANAVFFINSITPCIIPGTPNNHL